MNLDTLDKSFLRLVTDFSVAKSEMMDSSQRIFKDAIVISPSEKFLQISNSLSNIAFDDSYIVSFVDCSDNVILDITDKVYINEFQDHRGIYQIGFEIAPIEQDFYFQKLFLRFEHTGSDLVLWSNSFICTDNVQSIRLDYKNYSYYQGISYEIANFYQSIRIAGYFNLPSSKDTTKITTLINGDIRRSRTTQALEYTYNIDAIDTFGFDRMQTLLNSELVYINGVRFVTSENVQSDERQGMSNQFATTFKGQFVATETYVADYQIATPLTIVNLSPLGLYTITSFPFAVNTSDFSRNIASLDSVKLYNYDTDAFISDVPYLIVNESIDLDFTLISLTNGNYYIKTVLTSDLGQVLSITDKDIWKFSIANADFLGTDFNNLDFFTD